MKAFLAACVLIAAIAIGAEVALDRAGFSSAEQTSRPATVRLD